MDKETLLAGVSDDWLDILDTDLLDEVIEDLSDVSHITPPANKVFEFARLTNLSDIKVVILGQDPYPKAGDAHGLAFSCMSGVPASLRNIYKCLVKWELIDKVPSSGNLTRWAKQGVLLLNCALTTITGKTNAHKKVWAKYTDELISKFQNVTFLLWGKFAEKKSKYIHESCDLMVYTHPSPLAQSKAKFIKCDHFSKMAKKHGIDWNVEEPQNEVEKGFGMYPGKTVAFTDGSCYPNKRCKEAVAGYAAAFVLGEFDGKVLYGNIDNTKHYASNQRAEGYAIYKVMEYLHERMDEWESVVIVSDSDFWIKMIEMYMPKWEERSIDFSEKKNSDLTTMLWEMYKFLIEEEKEIEFRHIRSHNKDGWKDHDKESYEYFCWYYNDYIDQFAGYARVNVEPGKDVVEDV